MRASLPASRSGLEADRDLFREGGGCGRGRGRGRDWRGGLERLESEDGYEGCVILEGPREGIRGGGGVVSSGAGVFCLLWWVVGAAGIGFGRDGVVIWWW